MEEEELALLLGEVHLKGSFWLAVGGYPNGEC